MTMDKQSIIDPQIKTKVKTQKWYFHTRANNLAIENIKKQSINVPPRYEYIVECTRQKEYHANVLLPNGDVILCCMDYALKHKLGNLLEQSYEEILNSQELEHLNKLNNDIGFSDKTLCKSCNDAHCHTPWNNIEVYKKMQQIDPGFKL
jgi:radical SAM protein with 4Fe4S-binding SPASM domain